MKPKVNTENSMFNLSPYESFETKPYKMYSAKKIIKQKIKKIKEKNGEIDIPQK